MYSRVALPGGGVEHGAAARSAPASGAGRRSSCGRPMRTSRPSSNSISAVAVALHGGLAGDEDPVVGLGVVARHALLVALAVVDVHVQHPRR